MQNHSFDPENTISGALYALSPREVIRLGIESCRAVQETFGETGCHGGIYPGNISITQDGLLLGPSKELSINELDPDALEYISPEQFWNGETAPAADVYSIGLVMYTALNEGTMPFHDGPDSSNVPEKRANALQRRMNGETPPYPKTACRELGDVVLRAIAFKKENRYESVASLCAALEGLPESAAIPAAVPVMPLSDEEKQAVKNYKVDKNFERTEPQKPKKPRKERPVVDEELEVEQFRNPPPRRKTWLVPVIIIAAVVIAAVILLKGCGNGAEGQGAVSPPVSVSPVVDETPNVTPDPVTSDDSAGVTDEPPDVTEQSDAEPTYQLVIEDVTWDEAVARCEEMGGHLVTIKDEAEYNKVVDIMETSSAKFVWLGSYRAEDGLWYYVTGERMTYAVWEVGEPSVTDSNGTPEDYAIMWKSHNSGTWCYNDTSDPLGLLPGTYSGYTAYICQFD